MKTILMLTLLALVGVAMMPTVSANAGGRCNTGLDAACQYCSLNGSGWGSDWSNCDGNQPSYHWEYCTLWQGTSCVIG